MACGGNTTVQTLADVRSTFDNCTSYDGSVVFRNIEVPQGTPPEVYLRDLETVQGSLTFVNLFETSSECTFDFTNLQTVSGELSFRNLNNVPMPGFPALQTIGAFTFDNVTFSNTGLQPAIFGWSATSTAVPGTPDYQFPVLQSINSLNFTGCKELTGIGPFGPIYSVPYSTEPVSISISSNKDLKSLKVLGYATSGTHTNLIVRQNNRSLNVSTDIVDGFFQINQVAKLTANRLVSLTSSTGQDLGTTQSISDNTFGSLSFPNLTTIKDTDLQIDNNIYLSNLSLPVLQSVSRLEISYNTHLQTVDLSSVTEVDNLEIAGPVQKSVFHNTIALF